MISLIAFSITTYKARARDLQRVTDLRKINQSLEGYFAANDKYPPTGCGIDGYDCTTIDASAFITSGQVEWAASPIAMTERDALGNPIGSIFGNSIGGSAIGYLSVLLSPLLSPFAPEETSALALSAGALERSLAPYLGNGILPRDPVNS